MQDEINSWASERYEANLEEAEARASSQGSNFYRINENEQQNYIQNQFYQEPGYAEMSDAAHNNH